MKNIDYEIRFIFCWLIIFFATIIIIFSVRLLFESLFSISTSANLVPAMMVATFLGFLLIELGILVGGSNEQDHNKAKQNNE